MTTFISEGRQDPSAAGDTTRVTSAPVPIGEICTLEGLPDHLPHAFLGIEIVDGSLDPVTATGGQFDVLIRPWVSPGADEAPPTSTIDATALEAIDWLINTSRITVTPTAVGGGGAVYYIVRILVNRS